MPNRIPEIQYPKPISRCHLCSNVSICWGRTAKYKYNFLRLLSVQYRCLRPPYFRCPPPTVRRKHFHLHTLHNVVSNVYQHIPGCLFDIYVRARMPERNRHTSSSHRHEPSSFRNNGIYIAGDAKIVVQNSVSMGCDVLLTPGSEKGGRLNAALYLLRHPRRSLSQLRHHMQEDGTLLTCGYGPEMIEPSDIPHERHGRPASGCHCLNNSTEIGRPANEDNETERSSSQKHRRRSSRRRRGRSSSVSTQRCHDKMPALPAPYSWTMIAPAMIQEVHVMNGDVRGAAPAEQQPRSRSRRPSAPRPHAVHPYVPAPEDLPIPDHVFAQPAAQDLSGLHDQPPKHILDQRHGSATRRRGLATSASDTTWATARTRV